MARSAAARSGNFSKQSGELFPPGAGQHVVLFRVFVVVLQQLVVRDLRGPFDLLPNHRADQHLLAEILLLLLDARAELVEFGLQGGQRIHLQLLHGFGHLLVVVLLFHLLVDVGQHLFLLVGRNGPQEVQQDQLDLDLAGQHLLDDTSPAAAAFDPRVPLPSYFSRA